MAQRLEGWAVAAGLALAGSPAHPALRAQGAPRRFQQASQAARQDARRSARLTVRCRMRTPCFLWTALPSWAWEPRGGGDAAARASGTAQLHPDGQLESEHLHDDDADQERVASSGRTRGRRSDREDPGDRVRVIYVPTPADVADEMVALAGVAPADVVFEPGCGDARITIAAIRRGARRAICVDLDPERAQESRANVQQAGLADRIDVREGDALDVHDLSEVTVVFLYMGDHFNLLIRPVLWRALKPGSRVVSHRFTMGDWQPDKTVTVQSLDGGGTYDLHLWTITEEVKRKAAR